MRSPKPAKEDPNVVAAREREQRRAETARTEETQAYLQGATIRRNRRFGKIGGGGGSVPIYGATPGTSTVRSGSGASGFGLDGPGAGGFGRGLSGPNAAQVY